MSNLLQKASIVTTPTAYGVGVLNSIKPAYALSEELVTNGGFESSASWTVSGTDSTHIATFSNGTLRYQSDTTSPQLIVAQAGVLQTGRLYKITVNVTTLTSGSVKVDSLGGLNITPSAGTNIFYKTATGTTFNITRATTNVDVTIDSVSVKLITDADFQFSRNSSATRVNPDYLIQDVSILSSNLVQNGNFSELGAEEIINGGFQGNANNWLLEAGITYGNNNIVFASDSNQKAIQTQTFIVGKTYKVSINLQEYTSGTITVRMGSVPQVLSTSIGVQTWYIVATGDLARIEGTFGVGVNATLSDISVKQVDPNDNWTLGTGWSFGTNEANANTSGNYVNLTQNNIFEVGKTYITTFTISAYTQGEVRLTQAGLDVSGSKNALGTYTTTYKAVSVGSQDQLIMQGLNSFIGSVTDISVIEIQQTGIPRLDYTNGTASILLEPQSTNLVTYSEDFSQWTPDTNASVTSNSIISPDGTQNADKLVAGSSVARQSIKFNLTASGNISAYVFAKKGEYSVIQLTDAVLGAAFANFDLESGLVGSTNTYAANIENYGNGWYRCGITYANNNPINSIRLSIAQNSTSARLVNFAGNSSDGLYIYGAQLENSLFPTSYIPTSGSATTRVVEVLNNAGNSDLINSTEGVLYLNIAALSDDNTDRKITLSDGTFDNSINIGFSRFTGNINAELISGGVLQTAGFGATGVTQTNYNKFAMSWGNGITKFYVNGILVSTHSGITSPIGLKAINFAYPNNTQRTYARCKTVAVFKEALSDTELACLTSTNNREIFLNYYYRMQYVGANTEAIDCAQIKLNV